MKRSKLRGGNGGRQAWALKANAGIITAEHVQSIFERGGCQELISSVTIPSGERS
jgi:hypothetical protein